MANVIEVENFGGELEIKYDNGTEEEIEGGIYERKNAFGDTVEERKATQADIDRLTQLADDFLGKVDPVGDDGALDADIVKVEREGAEIEIYYADGHKEELEGGKYELEGPGDVDLIERAATADDLERFEKIVADWLAAGKSLDDDDGKDDDYHEHRGSGRSDDLFGDDGRDLIKCGGGHDEARGRGGDDIIKGGRGRDDVRGDNGNDDVGGGYGHDKMRGGYGHDSLEGGHGHDEIRGGYGDDMINGGMGDDRVRGDAGDDVVKGGSGDDRVKGDAGHDYLDGGSGSDHYWGDEGNDTFVFKKDGAYDKIHDFGEGADKIDISDFGLGGFAEVKAAAWQKGDDCFIDLGDGDLIKLDDVELEHLSANDFIL